MNCCYRCCCNCCCCYSSNIGTECKQRQYSNCNCNCNYGSNSCCQRRKCCSYVRRKFFKRCSNNSNSWTFGQSHKSGSWEAWQGAVGMVLIAFADADSEICNLQLATKANRAELKLCWQFCLFSLLFLLHSTDSLTIQDMRYAYFACLIETLAAPICNTARHCKLLLPLLLPHFSNCQSVELHKDSHTHRYTERYTERYTQIQLVLCR